MLNRLSKLGADIRKVFAFLRSILSEKDGSGSASRTVKLLVAGACCLCLVLVTCWNRQLPSSDQLKALGEVIMAGSAAYGFNQLSRLGKRPAEASGKESEAAGGDSEGEK